MTVFERLESNVRSYCRRFPTTFVRARGALQWDERGRRYIDFFSGAGALNYGHNEPALKAALLAYLAADGVAHSLDMHTRAKREFLEELERTVLRPRGFDHVVMFPGPTGTNAIEAALKVARKATGRTRVVSFTNGFHGMTLGSLALTGSAHKRSGAGVPLEHVSRLPFDGYGFDAVAYLERALDDPSSGIEVPAAIVVEGVQAEGGVNIASDAWLGRLARLCRERDIVLIADEIQVGCGRTGPFFSFERAGVQPDIVALSKSIGGFGTPLSIVLVRRGLDVLTPGEHNGTFRGHNLAFVTATKALERFWRDDALSRAVDRKGVTVRERLTRMVAGRPAITTRGVGLIHALVFDDPFLADRVATRCFERGLLIETAGARDEVVKLLPPLTIEDELLHEGLETLEGAVSEVCGPTVRPFEQEART